MLPVRRGPPPKKTPSKRGIPLKIVPATKNFIALPEKKLFEFQVGLPEDVLGRIFFFLPLHDRINVLCVCRQFEEAALRYAWPPHLDGSKGLLHGARHGHIAYVVRWLQEAGQDFDFTFNESELLMVACEYGHVNLVEILLAWESDASLGDKKNHGRPLRLDPSARNQFAIRWSSRGGHWRVVERLLRHPLVDPSYGDQQALREACKRGHSSCVAVLLRDARVDPTVLNQHALVCACEMGHAQVALLLLKHPATKIQFTMTTKSSLEEEERNPSSSSSSAEWALRYACQNGHAECVAVLLADSRFQFRRGAAAAMAGKTALQEAALAGHKDVVRVMLESGKITAKALDGCPASADMILFARSVKKK